MEYSKSIGNIFLAWRKGRSERREIVGVIKRNSTQGVRFNYTIDKSKANKIGFTPYVDFPDIDKVYQENVLEIFSQRLTKPERPDINDYYNFWEIEPRYKSDKFYILAHTQGLLATDNFEFIADYNPVQGLSFISEVCGLSHTCPRVGSLKVGDRLKWLREKSNTYDPNAVKLFKESEFIGYVKVKHCNIFSKTDKLKIEIKSIDENGSINRVFIKIYE